MPRFGQGAVVRILLVLAIALALARIAATYRTFNATSDEPAHISAGMEWLQFGDYNYEWQHPPLARIAVALGPYLKGLRSAVQRDPSAEHPTVIFDEGYEVLYSDGDYWANLSLARLGTWPFLAMLAVATFVWGRRYFDAITGLLAATLLLLLPPILGHAGLATLDIACAATVTFALYQFLRWLEQPTPLRGAMWGLAVGLAFATKYSSIPFLAVCFAPGFLLWRPAQAVPLRRRLPTLGVAAAVGFLVLWTLFRFSFGPLEPRWGTEGRLVELPWLTSLLRVPIPMPELLLGIRDVFRHNGAGHDSFLLGQFRTNGWWYFFPVVLAVKTPLGFLLLAFAGLGATVAKWRSAARARLSTAIFFLAILGFCLTSNIDLGVRHILSLFPLLALLAADLVVRSWNHSRAMAIVPAVLVIATAAESSLAHPDYLAHFNPVAMALTGNHPEKILCESDLDWGQDLNRLSRRLRELGADHVSIAYFGSAPLNRAGLPRYRVLGHEDPEPGYIAVSVRYLTMEYARNGGYAWLKPYTPVKRIGQSIDLYYLDALP